jgi:hypothetical protein
MNPLKANRLAFRSELRAYLKTRTPEQRADDDYWNGCAVAQAKATQGNPARVVCYYADPKAPTRITRADDRLSRYASMLARIRRAECQAFDDPITQSAPGECGALIAEGFDRRIEEAARACGFASHDEAYTALQERVTGAWLYFKFEGVLCQA